MRSNYRLSAPQSADARRAIAALDAAKVDCTLEEAVKGWLALGSHHTGPRKTVAEAIAAFLDSREGLRDKTIQFYGERLAGFGADMGGTYIHELTARQVSAWLASLSIEPQAPWRAVRALLRFAHRQDWMPRDWTAQVHCKTKKRPEEIGFLTVDEAKAALSGPVQLRPAIALGLFAGIRPEEIARADGKPGLTWSHIDRGQRTIRIPAEASKTGRARVIEGLPECLWGWLEGDYAPLDPVCPVSARSLTDGIQTSAGFFARKQSKRQRIKPWPHDAVRHSFATYHVALHRDPGRTAGILGHEDNPRTLHRHYRGLALEADAKAYFSLTAPTEAAKVVAFA